jgi:hypothetical protein
MHLPHALQFAYGWTKLSFKINVVAVFILAPSIILMASLYGAVGAALIWVIFNSGLVLVGIQLMHRRLLRGEQWKWYREDVGLPLAVSLAAGLLCLLFVPLEGPRVQRLVVLTGITAFVTGWTVLVTPVTRLAAIEYFRSRRGRTFNVS